MLYIYIYVHQSMKSYIVIWLNLVSVSSFLLVWIYFLYIRLTKGEIDTDYILKPSQVINLVHLISFIYYIISAVRRNNQHEHANAQCTN
jgi:uncharacterized membrane protein